MTKHSDVTTGRHLTHRLAARLAVVAVVGMACLTVLSGGGSSSATSLGGWEIAYQGSNGDLFVVNTATGSPSDLGFTMASSTSPAISSDGAGGYLVVFQGSNHHLETYDTRTGGAALDTQDVMAASTSPAVTLNTGGSLKIVFHAASNDALTFYTPSNKKTNTPMLSGSSLAMAAGTSPSIAPNNTVGWKVAYQSSSRRALASLLAGQGARVPRQRGGPTHDGRRHQPLDRSKRGKRLRDRLPISLARERSGDVPDQDLSDRQLPATDGERHESFGGPDQRG